MPNERPYHLPVLDVAEADRATLVRHPGHRDGCHLCVLRRYGGAAMGLAGRRRGWRLGVRLWQPRLLGRRRLHHARREEELPGRQVDSGEEEAEQRVVERLDKIEARPRTRAWVERMGRVGRGLPKRAKTWVCPGG